ncbi:DUF1353 domain-containing protein [Salmonella enterica subsp. enterica serovar Vitkin]|nr:DUF1353 domain-containing protein [Salmonella enterica]ECC3647969.1 DUF1353 domain-containing protein [Salmonella enterica subsp. enterica]ECY5310982.1 DUF1353 domain-containing protein [Salmonella enterica subsp. enterica serovar Vitkin]EDR7891525.1 DUF1353 domain-containing protein [Salmonella enterica subsp. enterica serovar Vitkin]EDT6530052.1 DUF1353 domain-containing protein [Salmonella enterica subsp. enterica]
MNKPARPGVPRIFWTLLPPDGKYAKAAIIHNWIYDNALRTKKEADLISLDRMTVLGVPKWKRIMMYLAVRWFYSVMVNLVDTSTAPKIDWPKKPEQPRTL